MHFVGLFVMFVEEILKIVQLLTSRFGLFLDKNKKEIQFNSFNPSMVQCPTPNQGNALEILTYYEIDLCPTIIIRYGSCEWSA